METLLIGWIKFFHVTNLNQNPPVFEQNCDYSWQYKSPNEWAMRYYQYFKIWGSAPILPIDWIFPSDRPCQYLKRSSWNLAVMSAQLLYSITEISRILWLFEIISSRVEINGLLLNLKWRSMLYLDIECRFEGCTTFFHGWPNSFRKPCCS